METNLKELRAVQRMNRASRKAMADNRAMEEQMERENPLSGRGATPSMGLSQIRGGKKMMMNAGAQGKHLMEHLQSLHGSGYAEAFHKGMRGAGPLSSLGHGLSDIVDMFGFGKHQSDSDEEYEGGLRTGRYEGEGMKGGNYGLLASVGIPLLMNLLGKGKMTQDAHDKVKDMIENRIDAHEKKHHMKGGFMNMLSMALPLIGALLGSGKMTQDAHDKLEKMFKKSDKMEGSGRVVGGMMRMPMKEPMLLPSPAHPRREMQVQGMGKVKRVVGADDPRKKRAMIVKKVMEDKNCSLAEASRYVKQNDMYQKD